jgi:hypothetical protein
VKGYSEPEPTESVIKRYREIQNTYPDGHNQIGKIEEQIRKMAEKTILFKPEMVRKILSGEKT